MRKRKGLFAALSVTLASAILISASAATISNYGSLGENIDLPDYDGQTLTKVMDIQASTGATNGNAQKGGLEDVMIIPQDYSGADQAIYGFDNRRVAGAEDPGYSVPMGDGVVVTWKVKANDADLEGVDGATNLLAFDVKFNWDGGGHGDALLWFTVEDYTEAPKDDNGYATFVEMLDQTAWEALGSTTDTIGQIEGRMRTNNVAELTVGTFSIYSVDTEGDTVLTDVRNQGSTYTGEEPADPSTPEDPGTSEPEDPTTSDPSEPEDPEPAIVAEANGSAYTGSGGTVEGDSLTFEGGQGGNREFMGPTLNGLTQGETYKAALYITVESLEAPTWTLKVRPQNEYYFLTSNNIVYDEAAGGTQKLIIVVPFKATGTSAQVNTVMEGFVGSIDRVVIATGDYDFGVDQGDYKIACEYGRQELINNLPPSTYPRYEGQALDAGDPGEAGEDGTWIHSTGINNGSPEDPEDPSDPGTDEPTLPEGILGEVDGSNAAVHVDGIHMTEEDHEANKVGTSYNFTNVTGDIYGFYMDEAQSKMKVGETYKMAFYMTLKGYGDGMEGRKIKLRPFEEYYYNPTNEELYNTEVGGTQKVIVSVVFKYTGARIEGYLWNEGGMDGTIDKIAVAAADYDFGTPDDDYYLIIESVANDGKVKDAGTPELGSWPDSTIEQVQASTDPGTDDPGDNSSDNNNGGNNGGNNTTGGNNNTTGGNNNTTGGNNNTTGGSDNPTTGVAGVAAGTVMLAAAAAATMLLSRKKK